MWELTPYRVRVVVAVDESAGLPRGMQDEIVRDLPAQAAAAVGGYWQLHAAAATGSLKARMLRGLDETELDHIPAAHLERDKLILLAVRPVASGFQVKARELDIVTQLWNTPITLTVQQADLIPHEALRAVLTAFAPLARIDSADARGARLRLRGAALLPASSQTAALASTKSGTVFRPVLVRSDTAGRPAAGDCQPIPWTYLTVRYTTGSTAECRIDSGLASAIPDYHPQRQRWAVALAPPQGSTRVRLLRGGESREPLQGYQLLARVTAADDIVPRYQPLGTTGRDGAFVVQPGGEAVRTLLIQQGGYRLLEAPIVPGLEAEVTLVIDDDPRRVAIEAALDELNDRLTDLLVQRQALAARIAAHRQREEKAAADLLQQQLDKLPAPSALRSDLDAQERAIAATDPKAQKRLQPRLAALRARIDKTGAPVVGDSDAGDGADSSP